ncbi:MULTISPECIES: hypothetical protein [Corallococcus]|uniref:hypothetical protein n=1 Tax=Corallococcus TaxID=83461 RepID=UPI001F3D4008|nr:MULTISPECIES: hypothetical protein [Corallococcus]
MSPEDTQADLQLFMIRIQLDTGCNIMKLVPNIDSPIPGEVYVRRDKKWFLVGSIRNEDKKSGRVTAVNDDS